jgi:O-antigen ligase
VDDAGRARTLWRTSSAGAVLLTAAVPIVFLHIRYQPSVEVGLGSTEIGIQLSDLAVVAAGLAGLVAGMRLGFEPLRAAGPLWAAAGLVVLVIFAGTIHPELGEEIYPFVANLITAAKFAEYLLLAVAVPLLLRSKGDLDVFCAGVVCWSVAASGWGVLQFLGVISEFEGKRPGQREPSFLGVHDFAALSAASLSLALAVIALGAPMPRRRAIVRAAATAGVVGVILSGAIAGAIGVGLAAAAVLLVGRSRRTLTRRRMAAIVALSAVAIGGVLLMRAGSISDFARFLGIGERRDDQQVETYVQRTLLAYIGFKIFLDHPVVGVGWQASSEVDSYGPYLDDARRRFPDTPMIAFPSPAHPWGIQNAYVQALADLGVIGFAALVCLLVVVLAHGIPAALRGPPHAALAALLGVGWLLVAAGVWNGLGLVAGIPLDALTWLSVGLVATGLAAARAITVGERA